MVELQEKIKCLTEKQTWLRKELEEFLQIWEEKTIEVEDEDLKRVLLLIDDEECYYLKRGEKNIHILNEYEYKLKNFQNGEKITITEIPIKVIRKIVESIEENIKNWEEKIEEYTLKYQECIQNLKSLKDKY